ncbi:MAG TPA: hypothetical protein VEV17_09855 [Bryobacteraceae bacterium]|nr:hypothetical protein [Bryobacteraceae bacterium]
METVQDICRISALVGFCPIVRVAELQYSLVTRALDCGAPGIAFPRVESPELLEKAVSWTKFPPLGVHRFGLTGIQLDRERVNRDAPRAGGTRRAVVDAGIDAVMIGPGICRSRSAWAGSFSTPA